MIVWAIKTKDNLYECVDVNGKIYFGAIYSAELYVFERTAKLEIKCRELKDCKVVKLKIEEVEEV